MASHQVLSSIPLHLLFEKYLHLSINGEQYDTAPNELIQLINPNIPD